MGTDVSEFEGGEESELVDVIVVRGGVREFSSFFF